MLSDRSGFAAATAVVAAPGAVAARAAGGNNTINRPTSRILDERFALLVHATCTIVGCPNQRELLHVNFTCLSRRLLVIREHPNGSQLIPKTDPIKATDAKAESADPI
ncbi:unnamed protein product [Nesidiocoris tenuis]|uniref:Uncharacterized protein n=1 Tax=Nesidiocoris tenuis TaxID=355587 RepID=A0A6H5HEW3_9HEMI|nr:unnamed protein product [Nesidiocoris tenuis]